MSADSENLSPPEFKPEPEEPLEGTLAVTDPETHKDAVDAILDGEPYIVVDNEMYISADNRVVVDLPVMEVIADGGITVDGEQHDVDVVNIVNGKVVPVEAGVIHRIAEGDFASGAMADVREQLNALEAIGVAGDSAAEAWERAEHMLGEREVVDDIDQQYAWCSIPHLARIHPGWSMAKTVYPYPYHVVCNIVDDALWAVYEEKR